MCIQSLKTVEIKVRVAPAMKEAFQRSADRRDVSLSHVVRDALRQKVRRETAKLAKAA